MITTKSFGWDDNCILSLTTITLRSFAFSLDGRKYLGFRIVRKF